MPFTRDGEFVAMTGRVTAPKTPRGDVAAIRETASAALEALNAMMPRDPAIVTRDVRLPVQGAEIGARWYTRSDEAPGSALVYFHGGGMITGSVDAHDGIVALYPARTGVPVLSVDYRVAPEVTGTTLTDDGFAALCWFLERAEDFGVDPDRVAVVGDSGGGGVAAGVAVAARDHGVRIARQILIYPMLDDRNTVPDPELEAFVRWDWDNNFTGWNALLGDALGGDDVSPLAAPARLTDFRDLAPAFIDVGELDIFRDESIRYALGLYGAGVSTELHVRAGVAHGFDLYQATSVAQRAWADRIRVIASL